jgi:hypothetical protein
MPAGRRDESIPRHTSHEMLSALAWYVRHVARLEPLFGRVTVKRKRNPASPVRRRSSAFRDPKICVNFLLLTWLGVRRLSQISRQLTGHEDLAELFGLRRFCDHTTAHSFLNGFHRTHLAQLDRVNATLLKRHGAAPGLRMPVVDMAAARRTVRHVSPPRRGEYRWVVGFCAGEAIAQRLEYGQVSWRALVTDTLAAARACLSHKPCLLRLPGMAISQELLTDLARGRQRFLATTSWAWALAQRDDRPAQLPWLSLGGRTRLRDLGPDRDGFGAIRTVLIEWLPGEPDVQPERYALVTSLLDTPVQALVPVAESRMSLSGFFGHPTWPLRDGKPPSSDPRGVAAYCRLATIATNVLVLFARHLGGRWDADSLRESLRAAPSGAPVRGPSAADQVLEALRPLVVAQSS